MLIKSYRLRLALGSFAAALSLIVVLAFALYHEYSKELVRKLDEKLLKGAKVDLQHDYNRMLNTGNEEIIKKVGDQFYQVTVRNGKVIVNTLGASQQRPVDLRLVGKAFRGVPEYESFEYLGEDYRGIYFPVDEFSVMHSWAPLKEIDDDLMRIEKIFMHLFPFFLVVTAAVSWYVTGKALDPVVRITSLAEQIRNGRLGGRIDIGLKGREIDDLATMFNEMLDNIQRSIETQKRFTSDVSHEIRSPLTSLRGTIEVALRKKRTPEEYEEILRSNLSDIVRLSRITDNLLFLTKADNNILELRKQWFDVNHFLADVVERQRYRAESAGLSITEDYQSNLEVNGDVFLLDQAFTNLIGNAIKYTPAGGAITVSSRDEGLSIAVAVGDTGIGIPKDDLPHVFERFYRVNKERSRKLGGTGLGLSITEWIVKAHNGSIILDSTVGSGTTFTVLFPKNAD